MDINKSVTELSSRVRRIEIKAKGLSEQVFAGQYHSAFKGRGMTFSEVRSYQIGDDIRDIDWNVTARYVEPHIKVFEEERELSLMLLLDISASNIFGSRNQSKQDVMTELAATLAFSAIKNNDKIGAILFTDQVELFIPPKSGRKHILYIIRQLLSFEPKHKTTNLNVPIDYLAHTIKKRCTTFIISDFAQKEDVDYKDSLRLLARKHDVIAVRVFDQLEESLPDLGLVKVFDSETDEDFWLDTSSSYVRKLYEEAYKSRVEVCKKNCMHSGVDLLELSTEEDFAVQLSKFFKSRL